MKTEEDEMKRIAGCAERARNIPGSFIGKVPFIGKILIRRKCRFYKVIERFGNKGICKFTAFFVGFDSAPEFLSFFDKELISIKNGTLLPDVSRQVVGPNTGLACSIGACNNIQFRHN